MDGYQKIQILPKTPKNNNMKKQKYQKMQKNIRLQVEYKWNISETWLK